MGKPTDEELDIALKKAARMREHNDDPYYVAKALLNLNYRFKLLENVERCAELYLRSGHGTKEHTDLLKAIEKYTALDARTGGGV